MPGFAQRLAVMKKQNLVQQNETELVFSVLQYGGAPGGPAFPGQTQDPLYGYFAAVAGQVGFSL